MFMSDPWWPLHKNSFCKHTYYVYKKRHLLTILGIVQNNCWEFMALLQTLPTRVVQDKGIWCQNCRSWEGLEGQEGRKDREDRGGRGPPEFGRSVNPSQTMPADYAHHITTGPFGSSNLPTALHVRGFWLCTITFDKVTE